MKTVATLSAVIGMIFMALMSQPEATRAAERTIDHAHEYGTCLKLVERAPEQALEAALAWERLGGGDGARHCAARAVLYLGRYVEAAQRYHDLALSASVDATLRPDLLAQAGRAWLSADRPTEACDVLSEAVHLAPEQAAFYVDRAQCLAALLQYDAAIIDLDRAITLNPDDADALALRAAAHNRLQHVGAAQADAEAALRRDPQHPEALLELGLIRLAEGDHQGARQSWAQLLAAAPNSAAADLARRHIASLDGTPKDKPGETPERATETLP